MAIQVYVEWTWPDVGMHSRAWDLLSTPSPIEEDLQKDGGRDQGNA
jgi:hypothetical protein